MTSILASKILEASGTQPQHQSTSIDATIGRLRQKYTGGNRTAATAQYGQSENTGQATPEDIAGYERLSCVKICAMCQGGGSTRKQFHHYHVDVDCEHCDGEGYYRQESAESKIQKATVLKTQATALFKQGHYQQADTVFEQGIAMIVSFRVGVEANALRAALLSNRAACAIQLENWNDCVEWCEIVLKRNPNNIKILWRLSVAYENLNKLPQAMECLTHMLTQESTHTRGIEALARLRVVAAAAAAAAAAATTVESANVTSVEEID